MLDCAGTSSLIIDTLLLLTCEVAKLIIAGFFFLFNFRHDSGMQTSHFSSVNLVHCSDAGYESPIPCKNVMSSRIPSLFVKTASRLFAGNADLKNRSLPNS